MYHITNIEINLIREFSFVSISLLKDDILFLSVDGVCSKNVFRGSVFEVQENTTLLQMESHNISYEMCETEFEKGLNRE